MWFVLLAAGAGMLFGFWPIYMGRSGLAGFVSAAVYSLGVFVFTALPALASLKISGGAGEVKWRMAAIACTFGGLGLLAFNTGLAKLPKEQLPTFVLVNILAQITVLAAFDAKYAGHLPVSKGLGIVLACIAAYLLVRR